MIAVVRNLLDNGFRLDGKSFIKPQVWFPK